MSLVRTEIGRNDTLIQDVEYFALFSIDSSNWRRFGMITWGILIHFIFNEYENRFKFTQFKFHSTNKKIVIQGYAKNDNESFKSLDFEKYIGEKPFVTSVTLDELYFYYDPESESGSESESELDITKNPTLFIGIGIVTILVVIGIVLLVKGKK